MSITSIEVVSFNNSNDDNYNSNSQVALYFTKIRYRPYLLVKNNINT